MDSFNELAEEAFMKIGMDSEPIKSGRFCKLAKYCFDSKNGLSGRLSGNYFTVSYLKNNFGNSYLSSEISKFISYAVEELLPEVQNPLIVGLGNSFITSDSLGNCTINFLSQNNPHGFMLCTPSVFGLTKIESTDVIKGISAQTHPDAIIAVDTLACIDENKLFSSVQISDAGIVPGKGLGNPRTPLTKDVLGVPVISIGIPLISYSSGNLNPDSCVTPKEIDIIVKICAEIIAKGIANALK